MGIKKKRYAKALYGCNKAAVPILPADKASRSSDSFISASPKAAMVRRKDTVPPKKVKEKVTSETARQPIKDEKKKKKKKKKKNMKKRVPGEETQPEEKSNSKKKKKTNRRNKKKQTGDMTQGTVAASYQERDEAISPPVITAKTKIKPEAAHISVKGNKTAMDCTHELNRSLNDEYGNEIDEYIRSLEQRLKPDASYIKRQKAINWSMRTLLVRWLIQVRMKLKLKPGVLCLAVNYLDRFLSKQEIGREKLQLVGCTALFIASKYELVRPIGKDRIVAFADGAFKVEELLWAESLMLKTLDFALGWPDPIGFLERLEKADPGYRNTRGMSRCFLDITMIDERFLGYVSSYLAAGAYCLARFMLEENDWSNYHVHYSGYTLENLRPLLSLLLDCCYDVLPDHAALYKQHGKVDSTEDGKKHRKNGYEQAWRMIEKKLWSEFSLPWE